MSMSGKRPATERQTRRYLHTGSKRWRAIRERILLRDNHLCRMCGQFGNHVDHINGRAEFAGDYRDENLQTLCARCHSLKTAVENGSFGNEVKVAFDAQGNPIGPHDWNK